MLTLETILEEAFVARERLSQDEIYRHAVAADAPAEVVTALGRLPEGEYSLEEAAEALRQSGGPQTTPEGVPAFELSDEDFLRELWQLHRTRHDTLRHASDQALERHSARMAEMEEDYLRRFPAREVDPQRVRDGQDLAGWQARTGSDQSWEAEDFAVAMGKDPTPHNIEWARRFLHEHGPSAVERAVP